MEILMCLLGRFKIINKKVLLQLPSQVINQFAEDYNSYESNVEMPYNNIVATIGSPGASLDISPAKLVYWINT